MKIQEIRDLSVSELLGRKRQLSEEIFHMRVKQQGGQLEKPSMLRTLRREAARVETVLTQKNKSELSKA
jgi:large subunit ribosomal protein L29